MGYSVEDSCIRFYGKVHFSEREAGRAARDLSKRLAEGDVIVSGGRAAARKQRD